MTEEGSAIVVLVTAPDALVAGRIARALVEERLAACVGLLPGLRSIYRWEGRIADEAETLLVVKTRRDRFAALAARTKALHPYQVPEIVAVPVAAGFEPYLRWIETEAAPATAHVDAET